MGTDYNHEIGYESLLADFKRYQRQTPKGVSLQSKRNKTILLRFKINGKAKAMGCNCSFTLDGMVDALKKANKVAEALKTIDSLTEFEQWYQKEILEANEIKNDLLTFGEAIKVVEAKFWNSKDRRGNKRIKGHPSHESSWNDTYGRFYKYLPEATAFNLKDIQAVISKWNEGTKTYKGVVSAMKRLARLNDRLDIVKELDKLTVKQTEFRELGAITTDEFIEWRDKTLGVTEVLHKNCDLNTRRAWLWVFSMQVIYGFRIHEVFAIQNLDKPFTTKDRVTIPALNNPENKTNIAVVGELTNIGTTTKTGYRLARPNIPPKHPNLLEILDIKNPILPSNRPQSNNPSTIQRFWARNAFRKLKDWKAPFTQTHADRNLSNINGIQAGIPMEIRAQSLEHTPAMNDKAYKKRQHSQTTIDLLLNSNTQGIDFVAALNEAKQLSKDYPDSKQVIAILIAKIYQKDSAEII